jgi:hypothetical protein
MRGLTIGIAALVLVACSAAPTPAPSASTLGQLTAPPTLEATSSPAASVEASASPAPSTAPTASTGIGELDILPPGAAVEVTVKELNLRKNPSTTAKRVAILNRGDVLVVSPIDNESIGFGPVSANGYTWYPVFVTGYKGGTLPSLPMRPFAAATPATWGWVAAYSGQKPYVTALPPRCPDLVDLENVEAMLPAERLACFNQPIVLSGDYGCPTCGAEGGGVYKPAWLATPFSLDFMTRDPAHGLGPTTLRFPPDGPDRPPVGSIVNVTVHVDDPRASKCTMAEPAAGGAIAPIDKRTAVLFCRERLVVERIEVLGPDPSFPSA